jgi:single-strand DNA-binding protein
MNDVNNSTLSGHLVRDPENRVTPNGIPVCDILIASNHWVSNKNRPNGIERQTTYAKVTLWGTKAEKWGNVLHKGDKILVVGKLVDDNYVLRLGNPGEEITTRGRLKLDQVELIAAIEEDKQEVSDGNP